LGEISTLSQNIAPFNPDVVFHLAWTGGNSHKHLNDIDQVYANVPGSLELIRIAKECGCEAFVYLGSAVEYGTYSVPVKETDPIVPSNLYGIAKSTTMALTRALCGQMGMRFCGVRVFWAYGPMDDPQRMVPSVTQQLLRGERPSVTPGEQLWDFLYIEDAVEALIGLGFNRQAEGIFNLGSGLPHSIRDVVSTIRDLVDPNAPIGFGDIAYRSDQVMHLQADISKLTHATGWRPRTALQEGLQQTVDYYRKGTNRDRNTRSLRDSPAYCRNDEGIGLHQRVS
jgi:nucleoside-diphosphate-sugar epimerase